MTSTARPQISRGSLHPMTRPSQVRHGAKILVVEDSYLLAELLSDFLRDNGMEPIGPAGRMQDGCRLAWHGALDGAILDMALGESLCFPIAAILKARKAPFIFLTGCHQKSLISLEFCSAPLVRKPFEDNELGAALDLILSRPPTFSSGHCNASDGLRFGSVDPHSFRQSPTSPGGEMPSLPA
jgi:DNA-binding response OmpR family regulator